MPGSLREEEQKVQVEVLGRSNLFHDPAQGLPASSPGQKGRGGKQSSVLGTRALDPGGPSLDPVSATLEFCTLDMVFHPFVAQFLHCKGRSESYLHCRARRGRAAFILQVGMLRSRESQ